MIYASEVFKPSCELTPSLQAQLKSLIDQLGPAIKTIQHMIGSWGSIRDDLKTISEDILSSGDHKGNSVMAEIDINGILDEWNALKAKGK